MSSINDLVTGLVSTFATATAALDVEVVDGWLAGNESGLVVTVGTPDRGLREFGALTRPAWRVDQSEPLGYGEAPQLETLTVFCEVQIPVVDESVTPESVRAEYETVVSACRSSLSARDLGVQRVWLVEGEGFEADSPSGWVLFGMFSVVFVKFVG